MSILPTKDQILAWIADNPTQTSKRDISRAFGVKGAARIDLKAMLNEIEAEGHLEKRRKTHRDPDKLPPVAVLHVLEPDADGDLFARPADWAGDAPEPRVLLITKSSDPGLAPGDRILARLTATAGADHHYQGRLIRRIATQPARILGIFRASGDGGRIVPIERGVDKEWRLARDATKGAKDGELVEVEQTGPKGRIGLPSARVVARLGNPAAPKAVSLIAIHQHDIPHDFPDDAIAEAEGAMPADPHNRTDLRDLALVTIDPADARDHDDAVAAMADADPKNPGGHIVWVAIADVAHYVTPGSALDSEARNRGNSTYFPDRVVPMLPDRLSGDLCSLHEGVERPCIAVKLVLNANGDKIGHEFHRAVMTSRASLSYAEVQQARDGNPNPRCASLMRNVITPLYAAYDTATMARNARQPLDLDLPERKIELDDDGQVTSVAFRARLDAHRLIEEFMVLANVAAAEELIRLKQPHLFRVHEEPSPEKLDALRDVARTSRLSLARGQALTTGHLNRLLGQAEGTEFAELINLTTLRSMTQAYYSPENLAHFGLALRNYAHFTSPIRRYADLVVHRALIAGHGWGDDGLSPAETDQLDETAAHISDTERRSMAAERDTTDRYLASYLADRVGTELSGRVAGIARFGVFVKLDDTGADGLIPMRALGREYFRFDRDANRLTGTDTGLTISMGQRATVRLAEAVPVTGGLILELLALDGASLPRGPRRRTAKAAGRKRGPAKTAQRKKPKRARRRS